MKKELDLSGAWELKPVERFDGDYQRGTWYKQVIPGHWQEIPELKNYSGRMVYRRAFNFSKEQDKRYWLRLKGVFYWCAVYLNGFRLGANQGYFVPADFEITEILEPGENQLILEVFCFEEENKLSKKQILGVWHHWDCLYSDWNPGGIWQTIEILSSGQIAILESSFHTVYVHPQYARIEGFVNLDSLHSEELNLKIRLVPENHQATDLEKTWTVFGGRGQKCYQFWFDFKEYRLWNSWDRGEPNVYLLKFEVAQKKKTEPSDFYQSVFGVRTFALRDYIAYLNEQRIFLRGSNYAPSDYQIAKVSSEHYKKDLELAKSANLNLLRVHAHIEKPEFYELADRMGILLWQDFPLQWSYDKKILPEALFQMEKMIARLYNHPSIIIWCLHNEPIKLWDTRKKPTVRDYLRFASSAFIYSWNREALDQKLFAKAKTLDRSRAILDCSGEKGLFRKDHGDAHLYFGWYFGALKNFDYWVKKKPERLKLVSEFGAQSFPNYESAIKFIPDQLEKLNWKELAIKFLAQPRLIKKFVPVQGKKGLKEYIQATQDYQSLVNRYYIDRIRSLKYRPAGGAIQFDFNDPNPAISWSVIDYWRTPKSSYFELKKAFSPVYAFALIEHRKYKLEQKLAIPIFVVNDLAQEIFAKIQVRIISPVQEEVYLKNFELALEPDSCAQAIANPIIELRWPGEYKLFLFLEWRDEKLENIYPFEVQG